MNVHERAMQARYVLQSNVLPVGKPEFGNRETGKHATCKWKGFQDVLQTRSDIDRLFKGHDGNIAMMVGYPFPLMSFDEDSEEATRWADSNLPSTPLVFSTGRGQQRLFKAPPYKLPTKINVKGLHGDLKASGYIIIPDSIHYLNKKYRWVLEPTPELFDKTPAWPEEVVIEERKFPERKIEERTDSVAERIFKCRVYLSKIFSKAGSGTSDKTLFRVASAPIQIFDLSKEAALALVIEWNERNRDKPWPLSRLEYKVDQAIEMKEKSCQPQ